jgi:hypothetical protein
MEDGNEGEGVGVGAGESEGEGGGEGEGEGEGEGDLQALGFESSLEVVGSEDTHPVRVDVTKGEQRGVDRVVVLRAEEMGLDQHREAAHGGGVGEAAHLRDDLAVEYPVTSRVGSIGVEYEAVAQRLLRCDAGLRRDETRRDEIT